jgi:hypothetical protein
VPGESRLPVVATGDLQWLFLQLDSRTCLQLTNFLKGNITNGVHPVGL